MSSIEVSMDNFNKEMSSLSEEQEHATWVPAEVALPEITTHSVLGQGTFGQVTLVTASSKPNESFAMKRMSKQSIVDSEHQQRVILEKNALQAMTNCPFIIRLLGTYQDESSVYFLSDVVMGGDLMSYMIDQDILKNDEAQFLLANLCEAITHCHEKGFIHRDIKPEVRAAKDNTVRFRTGSCGGPLLTYARTHARALGAELPHRRRRVLEAVRLRAGQAAPLNRCPPQVRLH